MLKRVFSVVIFILLLTSMLTLAFHIQPARAEGTIYIRADGSIDPPDARISSVDNVTYTFTDNINDSIVIERDNIVVDGAGYTVQGTGSGTGITLSGRSNLTIKNTEITTFSDGVGLDSSSNNSIIGNSIASNFEGIHLEYSSYNNVSGNDITTNDDFGIRLDSSSNNIISENTFFDNGLLVMFSSDNVVFGNLVNGKPLVYLEGVTDYAVEDAGQVILINCSRITVENLNLSNTAIGVELWQTTDARISGNNLMANHRHGIYLSYSSSNMVSGNEITANGMYGIVLEFSSDNNSIIGNNITANVWAGIYFSYSSSNIVSGNNISDNGCGVGVSYSSSNKVYHNNFIDNTRQAYVYDSYYASVWDDGYPSGGNFWSDYDDVDLFSGPYQNMTGSDGKGDTPYSVFSNNVDHYPLISPWNPLPVHNINTGLDYATIQEAINAPETLEGHTIFVDDGAYYENVVVNKSLMLIGEDRETTIIDGNETGNVVSVSANGVAIIGFTIQNGVDGIHATYSNGISISTNIISDNQYDGVFLGDSNNDTVMDNYVGNNNRGIHIKWGANNTLHDNNVVNNKEFGIVLWECGSGNAICSNLLQNNTYNIGLTETGGAVIYHNNFFKENAQVYGSLLNIWDDGYPSGGNYWSDYDGTDIYKGLYQNETGSDGIGDTPYVIDADNRDNYPLLPQSQYVPIAGDLNLDKTVDISDAILAALAFGSYPGHPRWNGQADLNHDNEVDIFDIIILANNFGKH